MIRKDDGGWVRRVMKFQVDGVEVEEGKGRSGVK